MGIMCTRARKLVSEAQHGDPRSPKIDAVDWVERIPLAETRNYVQRVMENLQVYRARFGTSIATAEPNLHRAALGTPVLLISFRSEQLRKTERLR